MPIEPVAFAMPNGSTMRGYATTGPDIEAVTVLHDMGDGTFATEVVWRAVKPPAPAPAPAPEAPADATPDSPS